MFISFKTHLEYFKQYLTLFPPILKERTHMHQEVAEKTQDWLLTTVKDDI